MIELGKLQLDAIEIDRFVAGRDSTGRFSPAAIAAEIERTGRMTRFRGRRPANRQPDPRLDLWRGEARTLFENELRRLPYLGLAGVAVALLSSPQDVHVVRGNRRSGASSRVVHVPANFRQTHGHVAIKISQPLHGEPEAAKIGLLGFSESAGWKSREEVLREVWRFAEDPALQLVGRRSPTVALCYGEEPKNLEVGWLEMLSFEAAIRGYKMLPIDTRQAMPSAGFGAQFSVHYEVPRDETLDRQIRFASGKRPHEVLLGGQLDLDELAAKFGQSVDRLHAQAQFRQRRIGTSVARKFEVDEFGLEGISAQAEGRGADG